MTWRRLGWVVAAAAVSGASPLPPPTQHPAADALGPREVRRDTLGLKQATRDALRPQEASRDTAPSPRRFFPPPSDPVRPAGSLVWECDRRCLLDQNPLVLADLLEEELPGLTFLRAGHYGGPHHLRDGALGPGFLVVREDGRRLVPLESGQVDLSRIPVGRVEHVRVVRGAGGVEVDLRGQRHDDPEAYTRVNAGVGNPGVNLIRGIFSNGLGRRFAVNTGVDLLNSDGDLAGSDRIDFWGSFAWMPAGEDTGVEIQWRNQNLDRERPETLEIRRRDVFLHGRTRLLDAVDVDVSLGRSRWELRDGDESGDGTDGEGEETPGAVEAEGGTMTLQAGAGRSYLRVAADAWDGASRPTVRGDLAAGLALGPRFAVSGGGEVGIWDDFTAASVHGGVEYRAGLGADVHLGATGATGVRGLSRPRAGDADSVTFTDLSLTARGRIGPLDVSVRGGYQDVSRQLPVGEAFEGSLSPGPAVEVAALQGRVEGPLVPLEWLLPGVRPLRVMAEWRHQETLSEPEEGVALFLPRDQYRASLTFREDFFQGDLELRGEVGAVYRTQMFTAEPGQEEPVAVTGWATFDGNAMVKLKDVRIWWRGGNLRGIPWEDLAGLPRPPNRAAFGISWEFVN